MIAGKHNQTNQKPQSLNPRYIRIDACQHRGCGAFIYEGRTMRRRPLSEHHKEVLKRATKKGHKFHCRAFKAILKRRSLTNSYGYIMYPHC